MLTYLEDSTTASEVNDSVLFLHVGLPKTGTTLLQRQFFPQHHQVEFLGKHQDSSFLNEEVRRFVVEVLRKRVFQCDVPLARRLFDEQIRPLMGRGKALVMSMEDGTHGSPRRRRAKIENLRKVCGDCRLLITLRNPLEYVQSMYLQRVKMYNCTRQARYKKPWLPGLESWLDRCWKKAEKAQLSHLDYAAYIADWEQEFGDESVGVLLYEQLKREPQAFFDDLTAQLGVQSIEAEPFARGTVVNAGWTQTQMDRLEAIKGSMVASFRFRFASPDRRRELLGKPEGPALRLPLSQEWRNRISEITGPGNQTLASKRELPLSDLGYPT